MSWAKLHRFTQVITKKHTQVLYIPRAAYARASTGGQKKDARNLLSADDATFAEREELEDIAAYMNTVPKKFRDRSEKERKRKFVAFKTIERKYFKPPPELNLLTWDAKEQIRYLHAEYPDEWTIPRLAQSFPISEEGIIRLLGSKFTPKTLERVIKHDRSVRKNWEALAAGGEESGGPIAQRYEELLSSGKMELLKNASGHKALPAPERTFLPLAQQSAFERPEKPGAYYGLIKNYYDKKEKESQQPKPDNKQAALSLTEENKGVLSDVLANILPQESESTKTERLRSFQYTDSNIRNDSEESIMSHRKQAQKRSMFDEFQDAGNVYKSGSVDSAATDKILRDPNHSHVSEQPPPGRRFRRKGKDRAHEGPGLLASPGGDLGMKGTEKIPSSHKQPSSSDYAPLPEDVRDILENSHFKGKFVQTPEAEAYKRELQYEVVTDKDGEEHTTAYIYDEDTGYHYPHGDPKDIPEQKVKLPRKPSAPTDKVYGKGKDYYDDDGEFLFRVP